MLSFFSVLSQPGTILWQQLPVTIFKYIRWCMERLESNSITLFKLGAIKLWLQDPLTLSIGCPCVPAGYTRSALHHSHPSSISVRFVTLTFCWCWSTVHFAADVLSGTKEQVRRILGNGEEDEVWSIAKIA